MLQAKRQTPPNKVTPMVTAYTPPSNPEAEQSVLGAILVRPEAFDVVATLITVADFYRQAHADIYQAMVDLREAGKPVDLVTVSALLKERGKIEGVGGSVFIAGLTEQCGYSTNAEYYAGLVRDKARLRHLLDTTQEIAAACFAPVENVSEFLSESAQKVSEVSETVGDHAAVTLETMVDRQSTVVEAQFYAKEPSGLPVGYLDLARLISWEPGDLIILAARPSMGKTALALNFMLRVAATGAHAGIFTLETSKEKLTRRFMSIIGRINGHRMNQGDLRADEWVQFSRLREKVEGMPIWIDDADLNIAEMRARARRQRKAGQLDFLVVDYLQLVKPMKRGRSREEDVAELSRGLKKLAKELEIPVLAVSALNRKFADRPNKRPMRSDLRESGAIEFDADKILFLYREEVDKPNLPEIEGIAEVDVDKHKDGPTGRVKLAFQKEFFRFEDLAHDR